MSQIPEDLKWLNTLAMHFWTPTVGRDLLERIGKAETENGRLRNALAVMYDKWENGTPCLEAGEDGFCIDGATLGNAFNLPKKDEEEILLLLKDVPRARAPRLEHSR